MNRKRRRIGERLVFQVGPAGQDESIDAVGWNTDYRRRLGYNWLNSMCKFVFYAVVCDESEERPAIGTFVCIEWVSNEGRPGNAETWRILREEEWK